MPIVPDTKDWTWVLERPCADCGFDASVFPAQEVAPRVREIALAWEQVLLETEAAAALDQRPSDDRWSTLEYACHVRDVFRVCNGRLQRMLAEDDPTFPDWDQDAAAVEDCYNEQEPATVAGELQRTASSFAASLGGVAGAQWQRPGARSDGARFTVDSFARYVVHDPIHHLWDVGRPRPSRFGSD